MRLSETIASPTRSPDCLIQLEPVYPSCPTRLAVVAACSLTAYTHRRIVRTAAGGGRPGGLQRVCGCDRTPDLHQHGPLIELTRQPPEDL